MRDGRGGVGARAEFARYTASTFSTMPQAVVAAMVEKKVGRNGWTVMAVLCRTVYSDGRLGVVPADKISEYSGLTRAQVARGMSDLKESKIIEPVVRRNSKGQRRRDRSSFGHVAQHRICSDVWEEVDLDRGVSSEGPQL